MATAWIDGTSNSDDSLLYRLGHIAQQDKNLETNLNTLHGTKANTSTREFEDKLFYQLAASANGRDPYAMLRREFYKYAEDVLILLANSNLTTLKAKDFREAMDGLNAAIQSDGRGFNYTAPTIGTVTAASGNTGTCDFTLYARDGEANSLFGCYSETLEIECVNDQYSAPGRIIAGNEEFRVRGQAWSPPWSTDWPNGSGCDVLFRIASGKQFGKTKFGENVVSGGDFEGTFTSGVPARFQEVTGGGFSQGSTALRGSKALSIDGNGSTQYRLKHVFGDGVNGSRSMPVVRTPNCVSAWVRDDGTGPAAGGLDIRVTDATNPLSVTPYDSGDSAVQATTTVDLTSVGSTYAYQAKAFSMPAAAATIVQAELFLSTALSSSRSVYVDELVVQRMTPTYGQGPWIAGSAGGTNPVPGDKWTVAITQNNATTTLIYWIWRLFAAQWSEIGILERNDRRPVTIALGNDGVDTSYTDASYLTVS